jgi:hypothetical protein
MTYVWIAVGVVAGFIAGLVAAALCVLWLPEDYFDAKFSERLPIHNHPALQWSIIIGRNVLGAALIFAGVVMLVIPGPGLLAVLLGLVLVDFPGKHRLISKLLARPNVLDAANRLREKFNKPPLRAPQPEY